VQLTIKQSKEYNAAAGGMIWGCCLTDDAV